jgi:anti-anti-sigma factor
MTSPKIQTATVGINVVVTIKESLTFKTCEELETMFNQLIRQNKNRIVLDFGEVNFMDSQALELLLTMHESLMNSGGILKIFGLNGVCRDILVTTRLINLLNISWEMQEALREESP